MSDWARRDHESIWHPYTQHGTRPEILPVRSARGAWLELESGARVLDAISSWWVNLMGHGHPAIADAIARQARELEHVIFAGFTHRPAIELAETLLQATRERGAGLDKVFYSDNGSTAVEVAMKLAYQFHLNRGTSARKRFLALRHSYHGDTFGSMAVSEPSGFHVQFRELLAPVDFTQPGDAQELRELVARRPGEHAALIIEPMVQGAGGMRMHSAAFLSEAERICRESGILLICDEVFTGFYRTGKCFAFEHARLRPDLVCVSKGLTGGFLPLSATLCTREIYEAFLSEGLDRAFLHGHSYTANPVACAAALASWRALHAPEVQDSIAMLGEVAERRTSAWKGRDGFVDPRSLGTIGAVDLGGAPDYGSALGPRIRAKALEKGILLRPLGNTFYTVPPYCVTRPEIEGVYDLMEELALFSLD